MNVLDLFSGIGGFSLGLERAGMRTVAFCEIEPFCRRVLARHWPEVPCYEDVRTLTADRLSADGIAVDVVCGGFPCQCNSTASRGRKVAADLWPEMRRVVSEVQPNFVVAENVPGLGVEGVDRVCGDLEAIGYAVWPYRLDTSPAGRQRARDRFIFVAHANRICEPRRALYAEVARLCSIPRRGEADDAPPLGVDDGLPGRMDRLGALGNAVSPKAIEMIGRAIRAAVAAP